MPTAMAIAVRNARDSAEVLELDVYDVIGESMWSESVSAKRVRQQLRDSSAKTIKVRINSGGGDAFDGIAIMNDLRDHPAHIEVDVTGVAASAATIIMAAGDVINVADAAMLMIHEAWTIALGGSKDLESVVRKLDRVNSNIAATYARVSKARGKNISKERFTELMAATTWMTADEAIEYGLADKKRASKQKIAASLWSPVMARSGSIPGHVAESVLTGMSGHLDALEPDQLEKLRAAAAAQKGNDDESRPRPEEPTTTPAPQPRSVAGDRAEGSRNGSATGARESGTHEVGAEGSGGPNEETKPDTASPGAVPRIEAGQRGEADRGSKAGSGKTLPGNGQGVAMSEQLTIPEAAPASQNNEVNMTEPKQAAPQAKPKASAPQGLLELLGADSETEASAKASSLQKLHLAILGVTGAATPEMAMSRISAWKDAAEREPAHTTRITELETENKRVKLDKSIIELTADGKLAPSQQEWARQHFPNAEALANFAISMPQLATLGPREPSEQKMQLSAEDREACKLTGVSEEAFLEQKKLDQQNRAAAQVGG
jgi:ATP-dependent Clp protease protease subunit